MTNIDIAKDYIKAVQSGDQAALGALISPEVIWHQPGNNQLSGTKTGIAEFGAMFGAMMAVSGGSFARASVPRPPRRSAGCRRNGCA